MNQPEKESYCSVNDSSVGSTRSPEERAVDTASLGYRVLGRYHDSPGVIQLAPMIGLARRLLRWSGNRLPLMTGIQQRWLPGREPYPVSQFAMRYASPAALRVSDLILSRDQQDSSDRAQSQFDHHSPALSRRVSPIVESNPRINPFPSVMGRSGPFILPKAGGHPSTLVNLAEEKDSVAPVDRGKEILRFSPQDPLQGAVQRMGMLPAKEGGNVLARTRIPGSVERPMIFFLDGLGPLLRTVSIPRLQADRVMASGASTMEGDTLSPARNLRPAGEAFLQKYPQSYPIGQKTAERSFPLMTSTETAAGFTHHHSSSSEGGHQGRSFGSPPLPFHNLLSPAKEEAVQQAVEGKPNTAGGASSSSLAIPPGAELPTMTPARHLPEVDTARLADQVYAILVRRLASEKERKGF